MNAAEWEFEYRSLRTAVAAMRQKQKSYSMFKNTSALKASKELEAQVDRMLSKVAQ